MSLTNIGRSFNTASELTRRVTMVSYDYVQASDGAGGVNPVIAETFDTWARVEQKGGSMGANQAQLMADATYQVTIRYRPQINQNWNIIYEGQTFKIDKIVIERPNYKEFLVIDCSVSVQITSWS